VVLPAGPTLPRVESLSSARDHAGPEDRAALAAYHKLDDKFTTCLFTYLRKHDPTFAAGALMQRGVVPLTKVPPTGQPPAQAA
jgi:hypothetical protein